MPFSTLRIFSLNHRSLSRRLGVLRLLAILGSITTIAQWIVPAGARYILNGGRIYYSNEYFSLWEPVLPWPILSVPAWLTIGTGFIALACASGYLLIGNIDIANDVPYMMLMPLMASFTAICIAAFEKEPTGIFWTPGPESYPIGWHWIVAVFTPVLILSGIISTIRMRKLRAQLMLGPPVR